MDEPVKTPIEKWMDNLYVRDSILKSIGARTSGLGLVR